MCERASCVRERYSVPSPRGALDLSGSSCQRQQTTTATETPAVQTMKDLAVNFARIEVYVCVLV
jgi:hypothetical protein